MIKEEQKRHRFLNFSRILSFNIHREALESKKTEGTQIVPGLFLGSRLAALNWDWLYPNVKRVLNVTAEVKNYYEDEPYFEYMKIPVEDSCETDLQSYFESTNKFISDGIAEYEEALKLGSDAGTPATEGVSNV